ncbi:MAG TPA: IS66 family transposase [Geminicoccaceae bacterium]|nr:IS66 family transposase [Geminicoccaceae bacterium]
MWVNRGMAPFDPSRLTPREKDELILALLDQVRLLQERAATLEARLARQPPKTPANSSLPPSRGPKADRPRRPRRPRPHRPGITRRLSAAPDRTVVHHAGACRHCGATLAPQRQRLRHAYDHIDLPPIQPVVTRVQLFGGRCPGCRRRVGATPPTGMAPGSPFGPGVRSLIVYLHHGHAVGFERLAALLGEVFGLAISEGAIANLLRRSGRALVPVGERIRDRLRRAHAICCDETGARVEGRTHWHWVFAARDAVLHRIAPGRGRAVARDVLGSHRPAVWVSDRYSAQQGLGAAHQVCLAHILRDARYAIDAGDAVFAPKLARLLAWAVRVGRRRAELKATTLRAYRAEADRRLDRLLRLPAPTPAGRALQAQAKAWRGSYFVFLEDLAAPATNNVSERALRPSVVFRKVTHGFRSTWGADGHALVRSTIDTARLGGVRPLDAIRRALQGCPALPA